MSFHGFPDEAFTFYEGLQADNSKAYWTDHKDVYERCVRGPMDALLAELSSEFGDAAMFRPYRDIRFSSNKSPYKTHAGAVVRSKGSAGTFYVHLSAEGLLAAAGQYDMSTDQRDRFRQAVADDMRGTELDSILKKLRKADYEVAGDRLKTSPRGYTVDHPRIDHLRYRTLYAMQSWEPEPWVHTREALHRIRTAWRDFRPLNQWLATNVGHSSG